MGSLGLALMLLLGAGAQPAPKIELPPVSKEAINDYAKILDDYDREKIFSGAALSIMGSPTLRIAIFPELAGQDPDVFARKLADAWGFPTDYGYLLVAFAKEGRAALVVNLDASKNGFGPEEWRTIREEIEPELALKRWGAGLNRAVIRIMWEHEAARSQGQDSRSGVLFAHTMGRHPWSIFPILIVVIALVLWFSSSLRLKLGRR